LNSNIYCNQKFKNLNLFKMKENKIMNKKIEMNQENLKMYI